MHTLARLTVRFCSLAALLLSLPAHSEVTPDDIEAAKQVSASWLAVLDARRYAEGHAGLAPTLRASTDPVMFAHASHTGRAPLGELLKREVKSAKPIQSPVEATKGDYVVIEYDASFETLPSTNESVLLARQEGKWYPFSYSVKREGDLTSPQVQLILRERIDVAHRGLGISVGLIDKGGARVVSRGRTAREGGQAVDGDTVFELGSLTKLFTTLLLADAVERGEVQLTDPVSKFLPASIKPLQVAGKDVTLAQLATHTSGLPRIPSNMPQRDITNPYADYTVALLYEFLNAYEPSATSATDAQYSNLGYGLLGHVLALRAGKDYEALLRERVLRPLGMNDTAITLDARLRGRFAGAHYVTLYPVSPWDLPALPGAGALRSTMNDMLKFAQAHLGNTSTPLAPAIRLALGLEGVSWTANANKDIVVLAGATAGSNSFIALDVKQKRGVLLLSNSANAVLDIGAHLFSPTQRLVLYPVQAVYKETRLADAAKFDRYVGTYSLTSDFSITITREGDRYFAQATRQPKFELSPASETLFFLKVIEAAVEFYADAAGEVTHLMLLQNGSSTRGARVGAGPR